MVCEMKGTMLRMGVIVLEMEWAGVGDEGSDAGDGVEDEGDESPG